MGTGHGIVIVYVPDATNVDSSRGAIIAMSERDSQRRWSSHSREVEDKNMGELHDRIAKEKAGR